MGEFTTENYLDKIENGICSVENSIFGDSNDLVQIE